MEALGLGLFMVSACFFTAMLQHPGTAWNRAVSNQLYQQAIIALAMALTALFIFYAPFTAASGAHINPAVTIVFWRLGRIQTTDAFFYILFQLMGGTLAVYLTAYFMGDLLTAPPVNYVVTVPGKNSGPVKAAVYESAIAFIMMTMILFTTAHATLKKYTRLFAALLIFCFVAIAGPVSGFGMNPARSFASALPAHNWTCFGIYLFCPLAGMLGAAGLFRLLTRHCLKVSSQ